MTPAGFIAKWRADLHNPRPARIDHARRLDAACGWGDDWRAGRLTDEEILARRFTLDQARAGAAGADGGGRKATLNEASGRKRAG